MADVVEQLRYTWTPRGVEGINRFQIAGMSEGFKTSLRAVLPVVRKICRYDRPKRDRTANPTSFGWFDYREYRIAFCRVGLAPVRGKVANFSAHVLVGPPNVLREGELAATFGASFWWRGTTAEELAEIAAGRRDFVLPPLGLDGLLEDRPKARGSDMPAAVALADALLGLPEDGRLAVTGGDAAFGGALRVIGEQLPEALEGRSLSTYEGAPTIPFRIVGTDGARGGQRSCSVAPPDQPDEIARATLQRVLSFDASCTALHVAARAAVHGDPQRRRESLWSTARDIVQLTIRAGDPPSAAVLADPEAVAYVATAKPGRKRIADAVHAGCSGVREAVRAASANLSAQDRSALYGAIVATYEDEADLSGFAGAASAMLDREPRENLIEIAARRALSDAKAAHSLGREDAGVAIAHLARRVESKRMEPLLRAAARHAAHCAAQPAIPDEQIFVMFRQQLQGAPDGRGIASVLRARPTLLIDRRLDERALDRCLELLPRLDEARLVAALQGLLPCFTDEQRARPVAAILRSLPVVSAAQCLVAGGPYYREMPLALSTACDDLAAALLKRARAAGRLDGRDSYALAVQLLRLSRSPDHGVALELLTASVDSPLRVLEGAPMVEHDGLSRALSAMAIDSALDDVRRVSDITRIWNALCTSHPDIGGDVLLCLLLEQALSMRAGLTSAILLGWIAKDLVSVDPKLIGFGGRLRDRNAQSLADELAVAIPLWCFEDVDPFVEAADRRGRSWWQSLVSERRKLEPKRSRR